MRAQTNSKQLMVPVASAIKRTEDDTRAAAAPFFACAVESAKMEWLLVVSCCLTAL